MTKRFKIVELVDMGSGWISAILLSSDAECWQVVQEIDRTHHKPWRLGEVIEVEMAPAKMAGSDEMFMAPDWPSVGASHPVKYNLAHPSLAVAKAWGRSRAEALSLQINPKSLTRPDKVVFVADDFADSRQMSAEEKATRANEFVRFVEMGFNGKFFTVALYICLMRAFHFQRLRPKMDMGAASLRFHRNWFNMSVNRMVFFTKIAEANPNDEQHPGVADWGRAIRAFVIQRVLPMVSGTYRRAECLREQGELRRLLRKYGIPEDFRLPRQTPPPLERH